MNLFYFFLIFCVYITPSLQYFFGLDWGYCQHICTNNAAEKTSQTDGYYWREFNGVVPDDAWPAGKLDDGTTIYVGNVYDPDNHGYFVVTIYEGVEYVLNTEAKRSKLTEHIQILCTQEPEKFKFGYTGYKGYNKIAIYSIRGGEHPNKGSAYSSLPAYVAKSLDSGLIGQMIYFPVGIQYTTQDGQKNTSQNYEYLTFDLPPGDPNVDSSQTPQPKTSTSKSGPFTWQVKRGQGIVPNFFVQLKLGACSSICTNNVPRPETMYYWRRVDTKPRGPDALVGGHDYSGNNIFLFQSFENEYNLLTTSANFSKTSAAYAKEGAKQADKLYVFLKVLSTLDKNNFKWVSVTSKTVSNYKNVAVIGGGERDGTTTYIGRATDKNAVIPGRVYIEKNPRIVTSLGGYAAGTYQEFEILTLNKPKPPTLLNTLFSFFKIRLITHQ